MINHDFTGYWTWVFQLLLIVLWLAGPVALIATRRHNERSQRRTTVLGWVAVVVGVIGLTIKLGWFAAALDVALGIIAISTVRDAAKHMQSADDATYPEAPALPRLSAGAFTTVWVLIACLSLGSIVLPRMRHAGTTGMPDRLTACGRDYRGPGNWHTAKGDRAHVPDEMREEGLHPIAVAQVMWRNLEIWGAGNGILGVGCGMGLYLRTGPDSFRAYALLGSM